MQNAVDGRAENPFGLGQKGHSQDHRGEKTEVFDDLLGRIVKTKSHARGWGLQ